MMKGKAVSGGIGIGPAALWHQQPPLAETRTLGHDEVEGEVERLESAVAAARRELQALRDDTARRLGAEAAAVMEAHRLMLEDPALLGQVIDRIRAERITAPGPLQQVGEELAQVLASGRGSAGGGPNLRRSRRLTGGFSHWCRPGPWRADDPAQVPSVQVYDQASLTGDRQEGTGY